MYCKKPLVDSCSHLGAVHVAVKRWKAAARLSHTRAPPPEGGGEAVVLGQSDEKYDTMRSILVQEVPLVAARHCCKTWLRLVKLREATNISA